MEIQDFARAANQEFQLSLGETTIVLTLIEVAPLAAHAGALRQPYSLIFRASSPVVLPQKIYPLTNATLGRIGIFIVPVARDAAGVLYQAVFN